MGQQNQQKKVLSTEDKDAIIAKAKEVCAWIGWMDLRNCPGRLSVSELKKLIESKTGQEIAEYT